jgi:NitT/TauT family transport system substrate-binding protein
MRPGFSSIRQLATAAAIVALSSLGLTAGAAAQATKLSIGVSVHSVFGLPIYVANTMGAYKEEGLDVEIIEFTGGATATPALLGGSTVLQAAGTENLLKLVQRGQPIAAVMSIQSTVNAAIMVRKDIAEKLGRKPTLQDLKGMRIGTLARGGVGDMAVRYIVEDLGLVVDKDVILVPILGYDKHLAAMQAKDIDASLTAEPVQTFWSKGPVGAVFMLDITRGEGPAIFQDMNWVTLQGKKDWIANNKDTVRKVVRATVKAETFISNPANLDKVTEYAAKSFPEIPVPLLKASIESQLKSYAPEITEQGIQKTNQLLLKNAELRAPLSYGQVVDTSFADLWKEFKKP